MTSLLRGNLPGNAQVPPPRRIHSAAGQGAAAFSLAAGYSRRPPALSTVPTPAPGFEVALSGCSVEPRKPRTSALTARTGGRRGPPRVGELLRHRRGTADRERRGTGAHARSFGRGGGAAVSLLADGAEWGGPPARRAERQEARPGDGSRRRRRRADPGRLHVPRPVRRPRSHLRQDQRHARRERVARAAPAGAVAEPRPRLAVRCRAGRSGVGQVLRGRRAASEDGQDAGRGRYSGEGRLRPTPRSGLDGSAEAQGDHPGPAKRREPRGRPDAPGDDPLPQPRRRHAARVGAARAALRRRAQEGHQALPVDAPHRLPPAHLRAGRRLERVLEREEGVRGRAFRRRTCRRCRSSSRSPRSDSGTR